MKDFTLKSLYVSMFTLGAVKVDDEDALYIEQGEQRSPLKYNNKQLYIPTKESSTKAPLSGGLLFNPLHENAYGYDPVWNKVMDKINDDINATIASYVYTLSKSCEDSAEGSEMSNKTALKVMSDIGELPKDFSARMAMFVAAVADNNKNHSFLQYKTVSKSAKDSVNFNKKTTMWSPYYDKIDDMYNKHEWSDIKPEDRRLAGATLRRADGGPFLKIMDAILPGLREKKYVSYSTSIISPTIQSQFAVLKMIIEDLHTFYNKVKSNKNFVWPNIDLQWVNVLATIDEYSNHIRKYPNDTSKNKPSKGVEDPNIIEESKMTMAREANEKLLKAMNTVATQPSEVSKTPPWENEQSNTQSSSGKKSLEEIMQQSNKPVMPMAQIPALSPVMPMTQPLQHFSPSPSIAGKSIKLNDMLNSGIFNDQLNTPMFAGMNRGGLLSGLQNNPYAPKPTMSVPNMHNMYRQVGIISNIGPAF